jgi:hypothetical protein
MHLKSLPVNENWVDEYIAGPAESPDGVELSCLKDRIEPITIFQIQPDSIFSENFSIDRIAHYIMTFDDKYSKAGALSTASLSLIRELFVKERQHLAAHALFNTLSATSTRQSFFESYRALEFLFVLPHARALLGELAKVGSLPNLTAMGLAQTCYKHLGWKRVDRDSIRKLFAEFYDSSLLSFKKVIANATPFKSLVLPSANPDADDKSAFIDKFTDSYYSLRNQVVHCQWDEISLDDDEWRSIVDFTLACIHHIYDKHLSVPVGTANPMSP